jgi:NADP-dependent 3-hydroxy acid dehydrogenase YdfG
LRVLRSFLPDLIATGEGDVVFTSSVAASQPHEYGGIYSATKAAINVIAETLRLELNDSARVLTIAPGVVDTQFFNHLESGEQSVESIGFGALQPIDVAEAVVYALTRNRHQVINNITVRPVRQTF